MQYFTINTCSRQLFDFIIDSGKKSWTTTTTRFLGFILSSVRRRFFTNLFFFRPTHRIRRMTIWNFWSNKIDANLNVLKYCARVSINFVDRQWTNLSPFTKDFRVRETPIENINQFFKLPSRKQPQPKL